MTGETNTSKLEFHLGKDDWELYTERLELYFMANDIAADKQVAVLLTKISAETYKLIRDLCAPAKPSEKTFAELTKLMKNHLLPKPSETMERCKFYKTHQSPTESVAEFSARLKSLSINCEFDNANTALRDQFVCGLKDHSIKKALFREEKLTFDSAYKIAAAMEEAERNALSTNKITDNSSVNIIQSAKRGRSRPMRGGNSYRGTYRGNKKGRNFSNIGSSRISTDGNPASRNVARSQVPGRSTCYCCRRQNHWARDCYHRFSTCTNCKRKGHLASMCKASRKSSVQHVNSSSDNESDFYNIKDTKLSLRSATNTVKSKIIAEPMFLDVLINNKNCHMEIDSCCNPTLATARPRTRRPG
ncbi:uncharacterized protein [Cardiocondyla obscurior]|uniref:uncharacterized protein n=1 Tax=Cardiocondyla obscurior TaxID=286306 RepID=UPI00396563BA